MPGRKVEPAWFTSAYWQQHGTIQGTEKGRGASWYVQAEGQEWVWRHYRRGGLVARVLHDAYLWRGLVQTRVWREWHLLYQLYQQQLPVPQPIAARVMRLGLFYRGDILTRRIPEAQPLSQILTQQGMEATAWRRLGEVIRRFHQAGVSHADFNAHNILQDHNGDFYVIDFDRGRIRPPATSWQRKMLLRLGHSLDKLSARQPLFHFTEADWRELLIGYGGSI